MSDLLQRRASQFCREIRKTPGLQLNKPKNKKLMLLILLSGLFCFKAIWPSLKYSAKADEARGSLNLAGILDKTEKISLSSKNKEKREVLLTLNDSLKVNKVNEEVTEGKNDQAEEKLYDLVGSFPIKEMIPFIAGYDREVAALMVGIAKKESDWGRHAPSKNGQDCFNYWGYKSSGSRGTAMGYACFGSAEEAVTAVAGRIGHFVDKKLNTPAKMVVWKCGSSCAWDDPANVRKWIADVSVYYNQIAYAK
jgi:hypothetical protein